MPAATPRKNNTIIPHGRVPSQRSNAQPMPGADRDGDDQLDPDPPREREAAADGGRRVVLRRSPCAPLRAPRLVEPASEFVQRILIAGRRLTPAKAAAHLRDGSKSCQGERLYGDRFP